MNIYRRCRKLFSGVNDTGKNLIAVLLTPAINPCHGEITKKPKTVHRCQ
jgi:hypothetical protein